MCTALLHERAAMYTLFLNSFALLFIILNGGAALISEAGLSIVRTRAVYGVLFNTICGAVMIFTAKKSYKRINMILLNTALGLLVTCIAAAYGFITEEFEVVDSLWMIVSVVSSITAFVFLLPLLERVFNVATDARLSEYLLLKNPVLRELKEKAPGTYNHSLMVGTLAESCAEAIGQNPLLAKAAAYYHDIGKIKAPEFFIENQFDGYNPHDELVPEVSAGKIRAHTSDGANILRENGFPTEIVDAAAEHHGTSPIAFFYNKAKKMSEGGIDAYNFTYENDKPKGKISAIIMICDTVESAVRANQGIDINALVSSLIKDKMDLGQFSECDLSMKDFAVIQKTIIETIGQIYHSRLKYN
jgi:putative nucleotidyltransferase with HDIG domain